MDIYVATTPELYPEVQNLFDLLDKIKEEEFSDITVLVQLNDEEYTLTEHDEIDVAATNFYPQDLTYFYIEINMGSIKRAAELNKWDDKSLLLFITAHEFGHVHQFVNEGIKQGQLDREEYADSFAERVLGYAIKRKTIEEYG